MTATITLLGGPLDGEKVESDMPGRVWLHAAFQVTPHGRIWTDYMYDPLTGRYLGERRRR